MTTPLNKMLTYTVARMASYRSQEKENIKNFPRQYEHLTQYIEVEGNSITTVNLEKQEGVSSMKLMVEMGGEDDYIVVYRIPFDGSSPVLLARIKPLYHVNFKNTLTGIKEDIISIVNASAYSDRLKPELSILLKYLKDVARYTYYVDE